MKLALAPEYFERYLAGLDEVDRIIERQDEEEPIADGVIAELTYNYPIYPFSVGYFIRDLRSVSEDDSIDGLMLTLNSPGGDYEASVRLMSEIQGLGKPVFVHTNLMASGGLMAALPADKIFAASEMSDIGSIGAVFTYSPPFMKFMKKEFKQIFSKHSPRKQEVFRALKKGDESLAVKAIDEIAFWFQHQVKSFRDLKGDQVSTLSGAMFSGASAKKRGLIDGITTYNQAKEMLKKFTAK